MVRWHILLIYLCAAAPCNAQLQSVGGGVINEVRGFEVNDDSTALIIVGKFTYTKADSLRANGIAQWDGNAWDVSPFAGGDGDTSLNGNFNPELSVSLYHDTLFVSTLQSIWHYDTSIVGATYLANGQWHRCGRPNTLFWFHEQNDRLFGSGLSDITPNGAVMHGVNEWVDGRWQRPKGSPFNSLAQIGTSTYWNGKYFFGGVFETLGSKKVVAYDGDSTWTPLGNGIVSGGFSSLYTLGHYGDSLYAGGFLAGTGLSDHIVIWDGNDWLPFFSEVTFISRVFSIEQHQGAMYISGIYHFTGDTTWYGLLRYDGHQLCAIGGSMVADNGRIAFFHDDLYMSIAPTYPGLEYQRIAKLDLDGLIPDTCIQVSQTSVAELSKVSRLVIHPNPANDHIRISCSTGCENANVQLYNAVGKLFLVERIAGSQGTLSTLHLPAGSYHLLLTTDDNRRSFGRFVKQ